MASNKLKIIAGGTEVTTRIGSIKGIITCCAIRFDKITYEVSYFDHLEYKSIWMHEKEFTVENNELQKIGYK